jgi:hypothetical protein
LSKSKKKKWNNKKKTVDNVRFIIPCFGRDFGSDGLQILQASSHGPYTGGVVAFGEQ